MNMCTKFQVYIFKNVELIASYVCQKLAFYAIVMSYCKMLPQAVFLASTNVFVSK